MGILVAHPHLAEQVFEASQHALTHDLCVRTFKDAPSAEAFRQLIVREGRKARTSLRVAVRCYDRTVHEAATDEDSPDPAYEHLDEPYWVAVWADSAWRTLDDEIRSEWEQDFLAALALTEPDGRHDDASDVVHRSAWLPFDLP